MHAHYKKKMHCKKETIYSESLDLQKALDIHWGATYLRELSTTGLCCHNRTVFGVISDSLNNASRDEDSILDQIFFKQICLDFYYYIHKFLNKNAYYITYRRNIKTQFFEFLVVDCCTSIILRILNKSPKTFAYHIFALV